MMPIIINYVDRVTEIETTINTNIYLQKTPYIIVADKKTEKSIREVTNQITSNEPIIIVKANLAENLQNLTLNTKFVADKLLKIKQQIENEFLTFIGLNNNSQTDKKERLLVDEINVKKVENVYNFSTKLLTPFALIQIFFENFSYVLNY